MRKVLITLAVLLTIAPTVFAKTMSATYTISISTGQIPVNITNNENAKTDIITRNGREIKLCTLIEK